MPSFGEKFIITLTAFIGSLNCNPSYPSPYDLPPFPLQLITKMFRTAILRSAATVRSAARPVVQKSVVRRLAFPQTAPSFAPRAIAWAGVRSYSAGGGLQKEEVYGRIKQLLSTFDKVRWPKRSVTPHQILPCSPGDWIYEGFQASRLPEPASPSFYYPY